jgi:hypothetical protein
MSLVLVKELPLSEALFVPWKLIVSSAFALRLCFSTFAKTVAVLCPLRISGCVLGNSMATKGGKVMNGFNNICFALGRFGPQSLLRREKTIDPGFRDCENCEARVQLSALLTGADRNLYCCRIGINKYLKAVVWLRAKVCSTRNHRWPNWCCHRNNCDRGVDCA